MRVKPLIAVLLTVLLAVATILVTQQMGIWELGKGKKAPAMQADGTFLVEDIKGSFTFGDVSAYYGVPVSALAEAFGVDEATAASFACKDLSDQYPNATHTLSAGTVKLFVACYLGAPFDLEDGSVYLPEAAAAVVLHEGSPTAEQRIYLETHSFNPSEAPEPSSSIDSSADVAGVPESGSESEQQEGASNSSISVEVSGSSTLMEVCANYGVNADDLMAAFSLAPDEYAFYQAKDIKTKFSDTNQTIGPNSLKLFVALYIGARYDLSNTETYLPASAVEVLKARGDLSADQLDYLAEHTV